MLQKSTIQLLRFPFSYFLMPVFWFALSFVNNIHWPRALLIFALLHLLLYPSSNGYNSYMDRDTSSIGGIKNPMQPTKQLFYVTVVMDVVAACISLLISTWFAAVFVVYIICSRLYSYRGIRLKRFAVLGYLTVIINQGAITFFMVFHGASKNLRTDIPWDGVVAAAFLIGGFYPITQVYQHKVDREDNVETLSRKLGIRGTFIFCAIMYSIAFTILFFHYRQMNELKPFFILQIFFIPVLVYFLRWLAQVWHNESLADFKHTMQMNWLASTFTNLGFITLIILQHIG